MPGRKKPRVSLPRCAHCNKTAAGPHYFGSPKPDTDPALIHRVYDPNLRFVSIYHHCGHYTLYVGRPEEIVL
jgi:hypothetical protein